MTTEHMELTMIAKESERSSPSAAASLESMSRKEKRKAAKKEKRKQKRKEIAEKDRQEEEALLNDPEEQRRIQIEEEKEKQRLERERREFEERERKFLEDLARKKAQEKEEEEEEERRRAILQEEQKLKEQEVGPDVEAKEDEEWEYVEEGPPEIIWQGNEIIVKKNRVRVKKKSTNQQLDEDRPISNPLPPQSEAFADYKNASTGFSAQQLLENVAHQTPNFGTEQDKAHCPFHLKTGTCRFGARCSRVHFYPDKSCTLLIKNMYNGPGLAWEQDEGLEHTEEEVEHAFEEFYEDVHTEFLKFGELVNFKVCRNSSYHLRGNVYVHYKSLESAMLAYHSINGRYFAGKQVHCEFVAVTRWKVAICGEYVRSNLKICSRGSACNFIHCFRNPGGDYEWADWDKTPPRYWVEKMAALFGYSDQSEYDQQIRKETPGPFWDSSKRLNKERERYRYRRSLSKEVESSNRSSSDPYEEDKAQRTKIWQARDDKRRIVLDRREGREETHSRHHHQPSKKRAYDSESDMNFFDRDRDADMLQNSTRKHSRYHRSESYDSQETQSSGSHNDAVLGRDSSKSRKERHRQEEDREKSSGQHERMSGVVDNLEHKKSSDSTAGRAPSYDGQKPVSINDHRQRSYDLDSTSDWSDGVAERYHHYRRKSSGHLTDVSRVSDDYTEPHNIASKKFHRSDSEQMNSRLCPVQRRSYSSRKDSLSRKIVEDASLDEHRSSEEEHVQRNSSQSDRRSESYDSDFSCGPGKFDSVTSKKDLPKKSKRKIGSEGRSVYDHTNEENQRDDTGGHLDEDVDRRGRWESNQVDSEKQQKHRRKSCNTGSKHHIGSRSRDKTSDDYFKESRSRSSSSSKSSNRKYKTSSKKMYFQC